MCVPRVFAPVALSQSLSNAGIVVAAVVVPSVVLLAAICLTCFALRCHHEKRESAAVSQQGVPNKAEAGAGAGAAATAAVPLSAEYELDVKLDSHCHICESREPNALITPCGHVFCYVCAAQLQSCPSCNARVSAATPLKVDGKTYHVYVVMIFDSLLYII